MNYVSSFRTFRQQVVERPLPKNLVSRLQIFMAQEEAPPEVRFHIYETKSPQSIRRSRSWEVVSITTITPDFGTSQFPRWQDYLPELNQQSWLSWVRLLTGNSEYEPSTGRLLIKFQRDGSVVCCEGHDNRVIKDFSLGFDWRTGRGSYALFA